MFQRPDQSVLDQYIAGKITEEQLVEQSDYEERWGFPWEYRRCYGTKQWQMRSPNLYRSIQIIKPLC